MKSNNLAHYWSKSWPIAMLLYATCFLAILFLADFELAPGFTDMIGEATLNNIRVSARVTLYFRAAVFFLFVLFFSGGIVRAVLKLPKGEVIVSKLNHYAKIALIVCLQQVAFNEISFFFGLFFLFAFCSFLACYVFFPDKSLPFQQTVILVAGLVLAFLSVVFRDGCLFCFLQRFFCIAFTKKESTTRAVSLESILTNNNGGIFSLLVHWAVFFPICF